MEAEIEALSRTPRSFNRAQFHLLCAFAAIDRCDGPTGDQDGNGRQCVPEDRPGSSPIVIRRKPISPLDLPIGGQAAVGRPGYVLLSDFALKDFPLPFFWGGRNFLA